MSDRKEHTAMKKDFCTILIDSNTNDLIDEDCLETYEYTTDEATSIDYADSEQENEILQSTHDVAEVEIDTNIGDCEYYSNSDEEHTEGLLPNKRTRLTERIENIDIVLVRDDVLNCSDEQFQENFGVRRSSLTDITSAYAASKLYTEQPIIGITAELEILVHLYYLTHSEPLLKVSQKFGIELKDVRNIIRRCMDFITSEQQHYIKWPNDLAKAAKEFSAIANMPGVIGALACNDIRLSRTRLNKHKALYFNAKLNTETSRLLAVFDANGKFTKVFIGAPGSYNNATLLTHTIFLKNVSERQRRFGNYFILGDATFPCSGWLIKPFERQDSNSLVAFNKMHKATLSAAEQGMHLFRKRFPNVFDFVDYINLKYINKLILSACILHNMLIDQNDVPPADDFEYDESGTYDEDELDFNDELIERRAQLLEFLIKRNVIQE